MKILLLFNCYFELFKESNIILVFVIKMLFLDKYKMDFRKI